MSSYTLPVWNHPAEFAKFPAMPEAPIEATSRPAVAERLTVTREALDLTQAALCRMTGIEPNALNNAERDRNRISVDNAILICQVTGVSLGWIYQGIRVGLPTKILEYLVKNPLTGRPRPPTIRPKKHTAKRSAKRSRVASPQT
jgi:transcriptional regulator with XRE-family HTH domain